METLDVFSILLSFFALVLALGTTIYLMPGYIKNMRKNGMVGVDVNKKDKPEIPEMGGIITLFGFLLSTTVVIGLMEIFELKGNGTQLITAISVFFAASFIGIIDDVSLISTRGKAAFVVIASLPLVVTKTGVPEIDFPFGVVLSFQDSGPMYYLFWLALVPLGVSGAANAINMSAGYNGLECGQVAIASSFLLIISVLRNQFAAAIIFAGVVGASLGTYVFNRYPAQIFIGDVGTLGLGAAIAAGVIIGSIEFYGVLCILPAFYELAATAYYTAKGVKRRDKCHSPIILEDGSLKPPEGAEKYTLAYWLLSRKQMGEKKLVATILSFYAICGILAVFLVFV